ncbi:GTP cyclohydrolase I FolE [Spirochaeta cellobiosiphila]|uniref:GTP cyclohydrolase I FolE n=1 Tax=Spirochaeta cellobiosiphila TaxID=504483 RepID=UPI0004038216|nr:GTP cyclohydrolase I FolE [Spirochaeta cellobiosiphila]
MNLDNMENYITGILNEMGEDTNRNGLLKTPSRVAKAYEFLTQGYHQNLEEVINGAVFETSNKDMVIAKDIEIFSLCEHHMLPFFGKVHIGYIPKTKVLGVSKLARIADMFAHRLQIQENLTHQIAEAVMTSIDALGVGVVMEAKHMCMMMRGVEKQHSNMVTSSVLGSFRENIKTREEFMTLIRSNF